MLYTQYLESKDPHKCSFCEHGQHIYSHNDAAYLTYALAPYHRHHLLVIPNRHVLSLLELSDEESVQVSQLIKLGVQMLYSLGYENLSVLVREGKIGSIKSVAHLHYHIIPKHRIGDLDVDTEVRKILTEREVDEICNELLAVIPKD
jgi:ATP adenylyltransferase